MQHFRLKQNVMGIEHRCLESEDMHQAHHINSFDRYMRVGCLLMPIRIECFRLLMLLCLCCHRSLTRPLQCHVMVMVCCGALGDFLAEKVVQM